MIKKEIEGNWLGSLSQIEKAIEYYEKALATAQEVGDRRKEGAVLNTLGSLYSDFGQVGKAIDYYQKALAIQDVTLKFPSSEKLNILIV